MPDTQWRLLTFTCVNPSVPLVTRVENSKGLEQEERSSWLLGGKCPGSHWASGLFRSRDHMTSLSLSFQALLFEVGSIVHVVVTCHWSSLHHIQCDSLLQPPSQHSQQMVYCFWLAHGGHVLTLEPVTAGKWEMWKGMFWLSEVESHDRSLVLG